MSNFNLPEPVVIGIDHGYGNIKTARTCFQTGVTAHDQEPTLKSNLLVYGGRYYTVGDGHKEFAADKIHDTDFYILTLAAIACELRIMGQFNVLMGGGKKKKSRKRTMKSAEKWEKCLDKRGVLWFNKYDILMSIFNFLRQQELTDGRTSIFEMDKLPPEISWTLLSAAAYTGPR